MRNCQTFPKWLLHFTFPPAMYEGSRFSWFSFIVIFYLTLLSVLAFLIYLSLRLEKYFHSVSFSVTVFPSHWRNERQSALVYPVTFTFSFPLLSRNLYLISKKINFDACLQTHNHFSSQSSKIAPWAINSMKAGTFSFTFFCQFCMQHVVIV